MLCQLSYRGIFATRAIGEVGLEPTTVSIVCQPFPLASLRGGRLRRPIVHTEGDFEGDPKLWGGIRLMQLP